MTQPLANRTHDMSADIIAPLTTVQEIGEELQTVGKRIVAAKEGGASIILMMGAHPLRSGMQRYIIDLMERGFISGVALNGAGLIHDYELALIGATTESVARYIQRGEFGLWKETGEINDIVTAGVAKGQGLGEAVGASIATGDFPHSAISLLAAGHRLHIPVTIHVGIGYDIVFEHANCNGAAWGAGSYTDFLSLTALVQKLAGGVVMNFGSAVMAPEVFLKGLAMARNVAHQQGKTIDDFTTLVADLRPPPPLSAKEPERGSADYYFRPFKTMLVRTVDGDANSFYAQGDHAKTIPQLWSAIRAAEEGS